MRLDLPPLSPQGRIWVAYSGGLDSSVLLHVLHAQGVPGLRAIHIHHGLQIAADDWARRARKVCRALGVPLSVRRITVDDPLGEGPEAAARRARYLAFQAVLRDGDLLVTAHHRDDHAETVLLRALRGTGINGLAAMAPLQDLPRGRLWRPLLATPRKTLHAYAERHGLDWIDDPHNADARYARSWLRSEILPRLQPHWPQALDSLARLAEHAREAAGLLAELATDDLAGARDGDGWSIPALLAMPEARRRNALHALWIVQRWRPPAAAQLARLEQTVLRARGDAQPLLRHAEGEWRRYRDRLYPMAILPPVPRGWSCVWQGRGEIALPGGCGSLQAPARARASAFELRLVASGERFRPLDAPHTRSLKNLFQEAAVPPWRRLRTPVLCARGRVLWIGGFGWAQDAGNAARPLTWRCE